MNTSKISFARMTKVACIAVASFSLVACQASYKKSESANMNTPNEFCWNEIMTPNPEKAKEFYQSLFGWTSSTEDMHGMSYTKFMHGDKPVAGMLKNPKGRENIPAHWMSYVYVDDLDVTVAKAIKLGGTVVHKQKIEGFGQFAIIKDPTGAHFALWQLFKDTKANY
jgi:hypothetical protein